MEALSGSELDDPEFEQLQQILTDPTIDPEMYKQIMNETKNIGIQPLKFGQMHSQIKNDIEEQTWSGLRVKMNWKPTNMFNSELDILLNNNQKTKGQYKISAQTVVPDKTNGERGLIFFGRNDNGERMMLQSHINLSGKDKILLAANYIKPDQNQGIYEFEYERKFDRLLTGVKYTSNGMYSLTGVSTVAKNVFIGMEANINVKAIIIF
jgi:hypothetical protein